MRVLIPFFGNKYLSLLCAADLRSRVVRAAQLEASCQVGYGEPKNGVLLSWIPEPIQVKCLRLSAPEPLFPGGRCLLPGWRPSLEPAEMAKTPVDGVSGLVWMGGIVLPIARDCSGVVSSPSRHGFHRWNT